MQTAFCSYQDSTMDSGRSFTPAVEGLGQGYGHLDGAVGIVALAHVHEARQAADLAQIEVVEAVLAAGQGEHHRVVGGGLHEVGVVVAPRTRAVAAGDEEEVLDGAALHRVHHRVGHGEHRALGEARGQLMPGMGLVVAAQLQRLLDNRAEVLVQPGKATTSVVNTLSA